MGASESSLIEVNFNRSNSFYFTGEQVLGNIVFRNEQDKLKVNEASIQMIGELGYSTQETRSSTDSNGNSTTEHYTEYHYVPFLREYVPLVQSNDKQNKTILSHGTYTWPFEFRLPESLPPSSSPSCETNPYIKYYIRIMFHRSWPKVDIHRNALFTVCPRGNILSMNGLTEPLWFGEQNRKQLCLQACLLSRVVVPGQLLSFQLKLYNPARTQLEKIKAVLIQHRVHPHDRCTVIVSSIDLPGLSNFNETHLQQNFDLTVSSGYLTPTNTFTTTHNGHAHSLTVTYELRLKVKSSGIFTNFEVGAPVTVGIEPRAEEQQTREARNFTIVASPGADFYDNNLPPSYNSAMKNDNS